MAQVAILAEYEAEQQKPASKPQAAKGSASDARDLARMANMRPG